MIVGCITILLFLMSIFSKKNKVLYIVLFIWMWILMAFTTGIADEQENIKRITDEVEHFTDKFDYRHKDEPWGNSRDSVERGILKTASEFVENK